MTRGKVAVAMSGGVDSCMAAFLLKQAGYEVLGVNMELGQASTGSTHDVKHICHILDIPFYAFNFKTEFQQHVVNYFCQEYKRGRTPNPCIACNQHIKFDLLLQRALSLNADYLATGHYAKIKHFNGNYHLLKAADTNKDQSYFLCTLSQKELKHLLFPLGNYSKSEVRQLAKEEALPVINKPDSQDACFISNNNYRAFLAQHFTPVPGDIVDTGGKLVGQHQGIAFYTIGQRRNLGLTSNKPLYVIRIETESNKIVVGSKEELYSQKLIAQKVNWVTGNSPSKLIFTTVKIRYKSPEAPATLSPKRDSAEVRFQKPQWAITPGQAVVFYKHDEVLGGGIIGNREQ